MMNNLRSLFLFLAHFIPPIFLLSCANQIPPEGGPTDTSPPTIISTYPAPYTLHYNDKRLDLAFDKYVDHRSAEESIFISPYIADLEFDWSGKDLEVTFPGTLRKNTTYVVSVGTDVRDLRPTPNRMAQAFTFAFSTGADIDRGGIRGRVFPMKSTDLPEGVMIFAYQLANLNPDTLNPHTLKPDYITQSGKNGNFYLQHLELGPYRIIAVRDEYRNLLYDPETDEFGVPPHDYILSTSDTLQDNVLMRLAKEDTTAPRLVRADPRDIHHVAIEFSESIDTNSRRPPILSITDTLSKDQLKVYSVFPKLPSLTTFTAVTARQDSTKGYLLTAESARDLAGLPIDRKANSLAFRGSSDVDTLKPTVSAMSLQDSSRGVELKPTIQIQFSEAVQRESFSNAIALEDTSGREVRSSLVWLNDAACRLQIYTELSSKTWYKLSVLMYNALDWSGRGFRDSLKVVRFETLDAEALSSIEGTVVDTNVAERTANILVTADGVDPKNQKSFSTVANRNGNFLIGGIEEGRYVVHAFKDRNLNGKYDAGHLLPFIGSERFNYASDTLKVRARWPLEGVRIELQ
jgi:hypothetical protein